MNVYNSFTSLVFSILKGNSAFNIFYNAAPSSKKKIIPFSGLVNHCGGEKVQEVMLGDLMKIIFH